MCVTNFKAFTLQCLAVPCRHCLLSVHFESMLSLMHTRNIYILFCWERAKCERLFKFPGASRKNYFHWNPGETSLSLSPVFTSLVGEHLEGVSTHKPSGKERIPRGRQCPGLCGPKCPAHTEGKAGCLLCKTVLLQTAQDGA